MKAFIVCHMFKYDVFGIDDCGDIWRLWFEGDKSPYIQKLIGDEIEYSAIIRLLRIERDLYK